MRLPWARNTTSQLTTIHWPNLRVDTIASSPKDNKSQVWCYFNSRLSVSMLASFRVIVYNLSRIHALGAMHSSWMQAPMFQWTETTPMAIQVKWTTSLVCFQSLLVVQPSKKQSIHTRQIAMAIIRDNCSWRLWKFQEWNLDFVVNLVCLLCSYFDYNIFLSFIVTMIIFFWIFFLIPIKLFLGIMQSSFTSSFHFIYLFTSLQIPEIFNK